MPKDMNVTAAEALSLHALITPTEQGVASRLLTRAAGGAVTLFAFDAGQQLGTHSTGSEAIVLVLEGKLDLTIGGVPTTAVPGTIVRIPAHVPHAVHAPEPARMLLVLLRDAN